MPDQGDMMECELCVVDTIKIQPYIFGSNRLKENIGASHLVALATDEWVKAHLPTNYQLPIEENDNSAELIYCGGGNTLIIFRGKESSARKEFVKQYSRYLLQNAPGLQIVIVWHGFTWQADGNDLHKAKTELFAKLDKEKRMRSPSQPLLGLGVTAPCQATGFPATHLDSDGKRVSAEIFAKERKENYDAANKAFRNYLAENDIDYELPYQLDHLGRSKGEYSFISVVHVDGDGVGSKMVEAGKNATDNRQAIEQIRKFSDAIQSSAQEAMRTTLRLLKHRIGEHRNKIIYTNAFGDEISKIELVETNENSGKYYLPFRPILFGGDDVTFVCEGRLGLSLAVEFIEQFQLETTKQKLSLGGEGCTASAGIAMVKSHYPFARAYELASKLTAEAKKYRKSDRKITCGCLDWHFGVNGTSSDLEAVRQQYKLVYSQSVSKDDYDHLILRPVTVGDNKTKEPFRSWPIIADIVDVFQDGKNSKGEKEQAEWSNRRNKLKALREALRGGANEVQKFLELYGIEADGRDEKSPNVPRYHLPSLRGQDEKFAKYGWAERYCGYFDALELADWFIPLKEEA